MARKIVTIDFETEAIEPRPEYPPRPVGVSIKEGAKKARYFAWGHPTGNNCTLQDGRNALAAQYKDPDVELVFHNFGFDLEVAHEHLGLAIPPWHRTHCTMVLAFLMNPHASNIGLKLLAARELDMPPDERDAVKEWILANVPGACQAKAQWGRWICKAPGDLVGAYADGDTTRTYLLFKHYMAKMSEGLRRAYDRERKLLPILLAAEREGIRVDVDRLRADILVYEQRLFQLDCWIRRRLKAPDINLDADDDVADAIEAAGFLEGGWVLTPKGNRSTSADALKVCLRDKELLAALTFRGPLVTCLGTFMKNWADTAERSGGKIFCRWNQTRSDKGTSGARGARTGRLSSEPSLMNIPTDLQKINKGINAYPELQQIAVSLPRVRSYILPDNDDEVLIDRDYNGQEMRIFGHFENGRLMQGYKENPWLDPHQLVTDACNPILKGLVVLDRSGGKTQNFGKLYGQGVRGTAVKLGVSYDMGQLIDRAYNQMFPGVKELMNEMKRRAAANEPIETLGGRLYYCEEPKFSKKFNRWQTFDYKLVNYLIQGSAADQTKQAIINYHEHPRRRAQWRLTVHDQNTASTNKKIWREQLTVVMKEAMESAFADVMDVPVLSNGAWGPNFADLEDLPNGM